MTAPEEELMNYLEKNPYYFDLTRDSTTMKLLSNLYKGGKTLQEISQEFRIPEKQLQSHFLRLMQHGVISKTQAGHRIIYHLDFEGKKFMDLYKKSRGELVQ